MKNELTYAGTTFDDDALRAMQADVDTSLNLRVLDVDQMQITLSSRLQDPLPLYDFDDLAVYTRDENLFICAAENAEIETNFTQNVPLRFLRGGSQNSIWFLQQLTRVGPDTWTLLAFSSLGRLTQMPHKGGIYTGAVTAGDLLREICGYAGGQPAAGVTVYVAPEFESTLLYGWLPYLSPSGEDGAETGSARDNFLQVLFALNAAVRDDANGVLRVENLDASVGSVLDADRLYRDGAKVVYDPAVTAVTVLEHQWIVGSDTQTLFEGTTTAGQKIIFSEPMSGLSATGFTITESGANYAVVSAGNGTLTGVPYVHTTREITRAVSNAPTENTVRIEAGTLVSITNSADVISRLAAYYACTARIEADAVIEYEDAGDVVSILDPFDNTMRQACIEQIAPLTVSNILKGHVRALIGFVPWQTVPFEDVRELLTTGGTWRAADHPGVTQLEVVIIGGGNGALPGEDGQSAPVPAVQTESTTLSDVSHYAAYFSGDRIDSGDGGAPGTPGAGGKILRISISLSGSEEFVFTIGTGGSGAARGSSVPGSGTASVFGSYSSADGSSSTDGYLDPVTGTVYGQAGAAGIPGGKGASPNFTPNAITDGGNTYSAGTHPSTTAQQNGGYYDSGYGSFNLSADSGYGGGPAAGNNGANGQTGSVSLTGSPRYGYSYAGPGGNGANAVKPATPALYGQGGRAGHGGGGAGAFGAALARNNVGKNADRRGTIAVYANNPATGGEGSDGGDGAPGCIILYYRRPVSGTT